MPLDLVSIVIPVFNGSDFMRQAIDSALAQSWRNVEVVVVDDGSTDGGKTRSIAESYGDRIHLVTKANGGVASALNAGIKAMRGTWFSWLSHDDLYHPRKVETQMELLAQSGGAGIAFGDYHVIDESGGHLATVGATRGFDPHRPLWSVLEGRINGCTMLIRRNLLLESRGFDPGLPTTQDYELWFRLLRRHPMIAVPGALVSHRSHGAQGSRQARHLEEAGLLWAEMLECLTPEEMRRHGGSERGFLLRARRFLEPGSYAGAGAAADRLLRQLPPQTLGLVWVTAGSSTPAAAMAAIAEAGFIPAGCIVVDASPDAATSLALAGRLPHGIRRVRLGPDSGFAAILQAAPFLEEAELVLLVDPATSLAPDRWRRGAGEMTVDSLDGWLGDGQTEGEDGILPPAFRGALLSREAVQATLARCEALGGADAGMALGLVARLGYATAPVPEAPPAPLPALTPPETPRTAESPRPWLATTMPGTLVLDAAISLQRLLTPAVSKLFRARGLVDSRAYLAANPDLIPGRTDPVLHYLRHGWRERRNPRPAPAQEATIAPIEAPPPVPLEQPPCHLIFLPRLDGRAARHATLLGEVVRRNGRFPLFAWGLESRELVFSTTKPGEGRFRYSWPEAQPQAMAWLAEQGPLGAEVLGTAGLEGIILPVLDDLKLPYDLTFLDQDLATTWPAPAEGSPPPLGEGTEGLHPILAREVRRLAPSRYLAAHMQSRLGGRPVLAARPPEPVRPERFRATPVTISGQAPTRILLLGELTRHKGRDIVVAVALEARRRGLPFEFHVLGECVPAITSTDQLVAGLHVHGRYRWETLSVGAISIGAHLAWFPNQRPEGYDFALSEAMLLGLPILAAAIGAYPERLVGRERSWVMPAGTSPMDWLERLVTLRDGSFSLPSEIPVPAGLPPLLDDFYGRGFLQDKENRAP